MTTPPPADLTISPSSFSGKISPRIFAGEAKPAVSTAAVSEAVGDYPESKHFLRAVRDVSAEAPAGWAEANILVFRQKGGESRRMSEAVLTAQGADAVLCRMEGTTRDRGRRALLAAAKAALREAFEELRPRAAGTVPPPLVESPKGGDPNGAGPEAAREAASMPARSAPEAFPSPGLAADVRSLAETFSEAGFRFDLGVLAAAHLLYGADPGRLWAVLHGDL